MLDIRALQRKWLTEIFSKVAAGAVIQYLFSKLSSTALCKFLPPCCRWDWGLVKEHEHEHLCLWKFVQDGSRRPAYPNRPFRLHVGISANRDESDPPQSLTWNYAQHVGLRWTYLLYQGFLVFPWHWAYSCFLKSNRVLLWHMLMINTGRNRERERERERGWKGCRKPHFKLLSWQLL